GGGGGRGGGAGGASGAAPPPRCRGGHSGCGAGSGPAPGARPRPSLLDRGADHATVLRPAAVVIAHVLQAEEVGQDEPRVARALADAAVGDRRPVRIDALLLQVNRP